MTLALMARVLPASELRPMRKTRTAFNWQRAAKALLMLLLVMAAANLSSGAQSSEETIANEFRAGQEAAAKRQFAVAIQNFRAVLKLDPSLAEARANLGLMYYSLGEFDEAGAELSKAIRTAPELLPAQLFLGLSLLNGGRPAQAIAPLKKALQLDARNAEAARALLLCYLATSNYAAVLEQLEELLHGPANEDDLYTAGETYLEMGRRFTSRMAQQYRSSAWAQRLAGDLAADRADWPAAIESYRKALAADPSMGGVHAALALALRASGKAAEALTEDAQEKETQIAASETAEKDLLRGNAALRDLLARPATAASVYRLIRLTTRLGNGYFARLSAAFPESARTHELMGQIHRLRQDFRAALNEFDAALQTRPEEAELHRYAGEMLLLLDKDHDAEGELRQAEELGPGNGETAYLLAQLALKEKDTAAAIIRLRQAEARNPGLLEVHALLGTAYMHAGKIAEAIPELERAQAIDYHGDLNFQLFKAYRAKGQTAAAEKALARSKELRKSSLASAVTKISGESAAASNAPENVGER